MVERFRRKAMGVYGYKKGAVKKAVEDLIRKFNSFKVEPLERIMQAAKRG